MTTLTEQLRRDRTLWTGVVLVIAGLLFGFGGAFAIGGIDAAPFPIVWEVIVRYVPGQMHTLGVVLLLLAFGLTFGLVPNASNGRQDDVWTHYWLSATWGFSAGTAISIVASAFLTGIWAWGMTMLFAAVGALAFLCWRVPPGDGAGRVA